MNTCLVLIRDARGQHPEMARRSLILYEEIVRPAVEALGLVCERIDPHDFGINDSRLFNLLEAAEAVIIDAVAGSSDYFYSLGVRRALTDKPTLVLVQNHGEMPTDIVIPKGLIFVDDLFSEDANRDLKNKLMHTLSTSLHDTLPSYSPVLASLQQVPRIFLSYAHADAESVLAVDQWLRNRGARVDVDARNFIAGRDIREEIIRHVKRAGKVVCFYSKASANRYYPKLERRLTEEIEREFQDASDSKPY